MKNLYQFQNWDTKITNKDLMLIHLEDIFNNDKSIFSLTFLDYKTKKKYKVIFEEGVEAYRNMDEGCYVEMWNNLGKNKKKIINTFILLGSKWKKECEWCFDGNTHYVIATDDDVIEILSSYPPKIIEVK